MRLLAILLAAVACAPVDELSPDVRVDDLVGGARDRGRHPAVVALLTDDGDLCTGTLVGPRAVLTARHCVSETVSRVSCPSRAAQVRRDLPPWRIAVTNAEDARAGEVMARGVDVVLPATRTLCGADLAVLLLDRAIEGVTPMRVADIGHPSPGERITVVGYGRRGDSARARAGDRVRFVRSTVTVLAADDTEFLASASGCAGDSGGPAVDPETGRVVGVVSRGPARCAGSDAAVVFSRAGNARALLAAARARPAW